MRRRLAFTNQLAQVPTSKPPANQNDSMPAAYA
ncbi:Uncharacterised protein [Vibrio cholerae]|nr:Uncharacterised protein [Vibrio cholerae]